MHSDVLLQNVEEFRHRLEPLDKILRKIDKVFVIKAYDLDEIDLRNKYMRDEVKLEEEDPDNSILLGCYIKDKDKENEDDIELMGLYNTLETLITDLEDYLVRYEN